MEADLGKAYSGRTVSLRARVVKVTRSSKGVPHVRLTLELPLAGAAGPVLGHVTLPLDSSLRERFAAGEPLYVELRTPDT